MMNRAVRKAMLVGTTLVVTTFCNVRPASALMQTQFEGGGDGAGTGGTSCAALSRTGTETFHMIYLHGRSMRSWPCAGFVPRSYLPSGWDNINPYYDGNSRVSDSTARANIKSALKLYCRGSHSCAVTCYSAGCNRLLDAIYQLGAEGTPPTRLLWTEGIASAAGGTPVSRYTTKWYKKFLAKLFGKYAAVDNDLHDYDWIGGKFSYLQNVMPSPLYHMGAGRRDMCIKIRIAFFFKVKLCGNKYMPSRYGDGAVPVYSACGYASRTAYTDCCATGTKYANRQFDYNSSCNYAKNHVELFQTGVALSGKRLAGYLTYISNSGGTIESGGTESDCDPTYDDCDGAESNGLAWLYTYEAAENSAQADQRPETCEVLPCSQFSNSSSGGGGGGYDGGGGGGCFIAGTPITMADGSTKSIENISVGDRVLSYDVQRGQTVAAPVTELFVHPNWSTRSATVVINGSVRATANHPFFANGRWVEASRLEVGDQLVFTVPGDLQSGTPMSTQPAMVSELRSEPGVDTVYNFEVATHHNYFAGGMLVHNLSAEP